MRYRALDAQGDYQFGRGLTDFYVNSPQAVAQAILTRLRLWRGEWFIYPDEGTPWLTEITGAHTQGLRDVAIKRRVLETQGVVAIVDYSSQLNVATRHFSVSISVRTLFGDITIDQNADGTVVFHTHGGVMSGTHITLGPAEADIPAHFHFGVMSGQSTSTGPDIPADVFPYHTHSGVMSGENRSKSN